MKKEKFKSPIFLVSYGLVLFFLLYNLTSVTNGIHHFLHVLLPFFVGGAIAFVLNIPMSFFERVWDRIFPDNRQKNGKRMACMLLAFLATALVIYFVLFLVIPNLQETVYKITGQIPVALASLEQWLEKQQIDQSILGSYFSSEVLDFQAIWEQGVKLAKNTLPGLFTSAVFAVTSFVSVITNLVIGIIFSIYVLSSKEKLCSQVKKLVKAFTPLKISEQILYVSSLSYRTFRNFITGQCLEAVILGSMFIGAMWILRLPYAVLIGVVIMVTALIPVVGAFIGCVLGCVLILIVSPIKAVEFLILFLILQQIEGNLIYPRVVGNSVGLPSILVLVSVTVGGGLFGVLGILLFIPGVSVLYTLLREKMYQKLEEKQLIE